MNDDPDDLGFNALCSQFEGLLHRLEDDRKDAQSRIHRRRQQMKAITRVLRLLRTSDTPKKPTNHTWSPEQRQAAAERMRQRNATKQEATR